MTIECPRLHPPIPCHYPEQELPARTARRESSAMSRNCVLLLLGRLRFQRDRDGRGGVTGDGHFGLAVAEGLAVGHHDVIAVGDVFELERAVSAGRGGHGA